MDRTIHQTGVAQMEELFISILPDENKRKELLSACRMIAAQSLKEAGCIESRLFQDINEDGIKIEQKWLRQKLLMDYFRSDHFTALIGAMKWLGIPVTILCTRCRGYLGGMPQRP